MRKALTAALAALTLGGAISATAVTSAEARPYGHYYGHRGNGAGNNADDHHGLRKMQAFGIESSRVDESKHPAPKKQQQRRHFWAAFGMIGNFVENAESPKRRHRQ